MPDAQGNPTWDDYLTQGTDLLKTTVKYVAQDTASPKPTAPTPQTTAATITTNPLMSYLPFMAIGAVLLFVMNKRKK